MTDEEIVKALEWNAKHYEKMGYIDTSTGNVIVKSVKHQEVLDFIHRLQEENSEMQEYIDKLVFEKFIKEAGRKKEVKAKAREIFEKIFEVLCCFTTQGKSKEYNEGYIDCLEEIDKRLQSLAKEKYGVEV